MSRWCDQSIPDERNPHLPVALYEVAHLFGTLIAETILASVHVRAHKQAGHMDASDLIKALQNTLRGGGRPHMEGTNLFKAVLDGADLAGAHLYGALFLNCAQLIVTRNWQSAFRDEALACGATIPDRK